MAYHGCPLVRLKSEVLRLLFPNDDCILVGSVEEGGALTTPDLFDRFALNPCHLMSDGTIMSFGKEIGSINDIEVEPFLVNSAEKSHAKKLMNARPKLSKAKVPEPQLMTVKEAAAYIGCSEGVVRSYLANGRLKVAEQGKDQIRRMDKRDVISAAAYRLNYKADEGRDFLRLILGLLESHIGQPGDPWWLNDAEIARRTRKIIITSRKDVRKKVVTKEELEKEMLKGAGLKPKPMQTCANCGRRFAQSDLGLLANGIMKTKPACSHSCNRALGQV